MRRQVQVAIVGGGLAGSALATALTRQGLSTAVCDRHATYPADFRAEKLTSAQRRRLGALGHGDALERVGTPIADLAVARFGRIVERRPNREIGVDYADLVAAVRTRLPPGALHVGRVERVTPSGEAGREVIFQDGRCIAADLVVLATGLEHNLSEPLGLRRIVHDPEHCLAIGFDLAMQRTAAPYALTYHGERLSDRSAYLTLFPLGARCRANLFVYRRRRDDWAEAFRADPTETLRASMPGLAAMLGPFEVVGRPVLRAIALQEVEAPARDSLVLIGDAFATTCPTGGTGLDKVLTDVERLAALAPDWLASATPAPPRSASSMRIRPSAPAMRTPGAGSPMPATWRSTRASAGPCGAGATSLRSRPGPGYAGSFR